MKYCLLLLILYSYQTKAQSVKPAVVNSTGSTATNSNFTLNWSVGEMASITTFSSGNLVITTGVLQPEAGTPTGINNLQDFLTGEIKILPNPTSGNLITAFKLPRAGTLSIQLFDVNGRQLLSKQFSTIAGSFTNDVNMSAFANGTYTLFIQFTSSFQKTKAGVYKIQKIN
jgi:hypothetical protein